MITTTAATFKDEIAPLWREAEHGDPFPAVIELRQRPDGEWVLDADDRVETGTPMSEYLGLAWSWPINAAISGPALAAILDDEQVLDLADRLVAGHDVAWDGNNMAGELTDDADIALDSLTDLLRQIDEDLEEPSLVPVWAADDWMQGVDIAPDVDLDAAVAQEEAIIAAERCVVTGDLRAAITRRRDNALVSTGTIARLTRAPRPGISAR